MLEGSDGQGQNGGPGGQSYLDLVSWEQAGWPWTPAELVQFVLRELEQRLSLEVPDVVAIFQLESKGWS